MRTIPGAPVCHCEGCLRRQVKALKLTLWYSTFLSRSCVACRRSENASAILHQFLAIRAEKVLEMIQPILRLAFLGKPHFELDHNRQ